MPHRIASFVLCWVAVGIVSTWSPPSLPAAPTESGTVRVDPLEGAAVEGRLVHLDGTAAKLVTAAGERTIPFAGMRRLERRDAVAPTLAVHDHLRVRLTGGEILVGTLAGATSDGFVLQTPDLGRIALLLDVVSTVVAVPADAGDCFEPEQSYPPVDDDVVYARSGDAVAGIVLVVDEKGFEVETSRGRTRRVAWTDLLVVHLQNDPAPPSAALRIEIETVEGARLEAGGAIEAEDEALAFGLRSAPDTRVVVPWSSIRFVRPSGGAFVYASTLPFESEFTWCYGDEGEYLELLGRLFPTRVDRGPEGCPLRLGGRVYRHGFAVQARTVVSIPIAGAYQRFESLFGVDDSALDAPGHSGVDARVLGDGEVLWEAKDVRAGEAPRRVGPLDVSSVQVLVLEVDFGQDGPEQVTGDRGTWADPILFR